MNNSTVCHEADLQHPDEYKQLIDSLKYIYAINNNKAQELSARKPIENSVIGLLIHHEQDHKPIMLWLTLPLVFLYETTAMRSEVVV